MTSFVMLCFANPSSTSGYEQRAWISDNLDIRIQFMDLFVIGLASDRRFGSDDSDAVISCLLYSGSRSRNNYAEDRQIRLFLHSFNASALAVLQAITTAFTFFVFKKRMICLENRIMLSLDLLPYGTRAVSPK